MNLCLGGNPEIELILLGVSCLTREGDERLACLDKESEVNYVCIFLSDLHIVEVFKQDPSARLCFTSV